MDRARIVRWSAWTAGVVVALLLIAVLALAVLPFGIFKSTIEARLSKRFGSHVTIAKVDRLDRFSFNPKVAITGVRVPQPAWAGPGDLATIQWARLSIPVLPMLIGKIRPSGISVSGVRLSLVRTADDRENWRRSGKHGGGGAPNPSYLRIVDGRIAYRDAKQDRAFDVAIVSDPGRGLALSGNGRIHDVPVRIEARGAALTPDQPWPFKARLAGRTINLTVQGNMRAPLDTDSLVADARVRADDLKTLDAVIEAGLFGTQPIDLTAHVTHNDPDWTITAIKGSIGRSDFTGNVAVKKRDGRNLIDGDASFGQLDFGDLASDAGKAKAHSVEQEIGKRVIPGTKIDLTKLGDTDATFRVRARRLIGGSSPPLSSVTATLTLDHSKLTVSPLMIGLGSGRATGSVVVDQRGGKSQPLVAVDLAITGASLATLFRNGPIDSPVEGRIHLTGPGRTIRDAMAHADGKVGLVARDGTLPARLASLIGFDIGRGLTTDEDAQTGLRCLILGLDVRGGEGHVDPFIVDSDRARTDGQGSVSLASERIAIELHGAPKKSSLLRLPGIVRLDGTISTPGVELPEHPGSIGTIFKALGRTITGHQGPTADDADCNMLAKRALSGG